MKFQKSILITVLIFSSITNVKSQNISKEKVEQYITSHEITFNKNTKPISCNNIDSLINELIKKKINYSYTTFEFIGEDLNEDSMVNGNSKSIIANKQKSFIYYSLKKEKNGIKIIVVSGNNYF